MEENKNENTPINDVKEKKNTNFKTVSSSNMYNTKRTKSGFGKSVVLPFCSGVIGCVVVIGTCFGVPSIRSKILNNSTSSIINNTSSSSSSSNSGYVSQVNLSNYSDTAVYAANKILPSIVGIKLEYTVNNSMLQMFGKSSSSTATAKIVGQDEQTDLAVIKIEKSGLSKAEFADSDSIKVGEFAMAVGNPIGMQSSVTCGIVSAVNRQVTDSDGKQYTLIQTDAAINSGNSGGALVNSEGKVIGINTLKLSGTGIEGMGFAIPINSTTDITSQLIQYSKVKRPYIGITGIDLNEETAKTYNLVTGVYVKSVEDFSSGEKAGIKAGDVIIEADGTKISSMDDLNKIKNSHKIGDEMKIKVNRNGQEKDLTITLGEQP